MTDTLAWVTKIYRETCQELLPNGPSHQMVFCQRMAKEIDEWSGPEWDATDAAHPAWWRGSDAGCYSATEIIRKALDGEDDGSGVIGYEPLERARREILKVHSQLDELADAIKRLKERIK